MTPGEMVALPWKWLGPSPERDEHGNEWFEIRVAELPDFFVAAEGAQAARIEAAPALEAFLAAYVKSGKQPPVPAGSRATLVQTGATPREPMVELKSVVPLEPQVA